MQILKTEIPDVFLIRSEQFADARGSFVRLCCFQELADAEIDFTPLQVNLSKNSAAFTLRGMHFQDPPRAEAKLVQVTRGAIFDVALDLRPQSPTYRRWVGESLDATELNALFVPEGCAHGFLTLEDDTEVLYHMSRVYEQGWGRGVRWDDPAFAIEWPGRPAVISERDAGYSDFVL
jgi:dTDP-4-dehydrorhamnose 3,5-epimerase